MIALLILTNGRKEYLEQTMRSAAQHLRGPIQKRIIINDAHGDTAFDEDLCSNLPANWYVCTPTDKLGFAGAIQYGWNMVRLLAPECQHVFHLEEDFTFNEDIDLNRMIEVLESDPKLVQLALLRQAWNEEEKAAGGIVQVHPDWYEQAGGYVRHTAFFTTNPSLYRAGLMERSWPQDEQSEGKFSIALRDDGYHFGFFQEGIFAAPKVHHIGELRTGTGY